MIGSVHCLPLFGLRSDLCSLCLHLLSDVNRINRVGGLQGVIWKARGLRGVLYWGCSVFVWGYGQLFTGNSTPTPTVTEKVSSTKNMSTIFHPDSMPCFHWLQVKVHSGLQMYWDSIARMSWVIIVSNFLLAFLFWKHRSKLASSYGAVFYYLVLCQIPLLIY